MPASKASRDSLLPTRGLASSIARRKMAVRIDSPPDQDPTRRVGNGARRSDDQARGRASQVVSGEDATMLEEEARRLLQHRGHGNGDDHAEDAERVIADHDRTEQQRRVKVNASPDR